MNLEGMATVCH